MLIIYNELITINHPIGTSFVCGFQLSNKKSLYYIYFKIPLVDPLTLTSVLLLFNSYINITSQNSLQLLFYYYSLQIFLFICNLYNSSLCGSTPVLPGYLLLRHSCTWDKTSTFWSCQYHNLFY
jgi:hypothetical protein